MPESPFDENQLEETVNYWDKDDIFESDINASLSVEEFTKEFIELLKRAIEENPDVRSSIDKLCDIELYRDLIQLSHYRHLLPAIEFTIPESLKGEFIRLDRRVSNSHLKIDEYEAYTRGDIAIALREELGYNLDQEMGDDRTRELLLMYLEAEVGTIERR